MLDAQHLINSIGLVSDIAGALLIWRYGLPEEISRAGHQHLVLEQNDAVEIAKAKRYDRLGTIGILALVIGFALQLTSNFL